MVRLGCYMLGIYAAMAVFGATVKLRVQQKPCVVVLHSEVERSRLNCTTHRQALKGFHDTSHV